MNILMNIVKSIILSLSVFLIIGPPIGSILFSGFAGEFKLATFNWGYLVGIVPAFTACVINYILFFILPGNITRFNILVGFLSGLLLSILPFIALLFPTREINDFSSKTFFFALAIMTIPAAICGGIVNFYLNRWFNSDYES